MDVRYKNTERAKQETAKKHLKDKQEIVWNQNIACVSKEHDNFSWIGMPLPEYIPMGHKSKMRDVQAQIDVNSVDLWGSRRHATTI